MFTRAEVDVLAPLLQRASRKEQDIAKRRAIIGSLTKLQRLRKALRKRKENARG